MVDSLIYDGFTRDLSQTIALVGRHIRLRLSLKNQATMKHSIWVFVLSGATFDENGTVPSLNSSPVSLFSF